MSHEGYNEGEDSTTLAAARRGLGAPRGRDGKCGLERILSGQRTDLPRLCQLYIRRRRLSETDSKLNLNLRLRLSQIQGCPRIRAFLRRKSTTPNGAAARRGTCPCSGRCRAFFASARASLFFSPFPSRASIDAPPSPNFPCSSRA